MTQDQKRIKIAEACDALVIPSDSAGDEYYSHLVPDYFGDLNACHEMEAVLTDEQWWQYTEQLFTTRLGRFEHDTRAAVHASAAQRAEAFGRTLGLWK